jgi:hypothetical protein
MSYSSRLFSFTNAEDSDDFTGEGWDMDDLEPSPKVVY